MVDTWLVPSANCVELGICRPFSLRPIGSQSLSLGSRVNRSRVVHSGGSIDSSEDVGSRKGTITEPDELTNP